MPSPETFDTPALIAHILDRFHEGHRRDLAMLRPQARAASAALADHLDAMAAALEHHMFKEEARLFPMMEQGGHGLLPLLIDDIEAEHRSHEEAVARLRALMEVPMPDALRRGLERFVDDLAEHVRLEDAVLFRHFPRDAGVRPLA